jgi:hypothetical protein
VVVEEENNAFHNNNWQPKTPQNAVKKNQPPQSRIDTAQIIAITVVFSPRLQPLTSPRPIPFEPSLERDVGLLQDKALTAVRRRRGMRGRR